MLLVDLAQQKQQAMQKAFIILFLIIEVIIFTPSYAQTIWNGPLLHFEKADGVNWTLVENQDRITATVWLTRANTRGLFNIFSEQDADDQSPLDTEWALGSTNHLDTLNFKKWSELHQGNPPSLIGKVLVLHVIPDDIFIDFKLTSWSIGRNGGQGGFAYERSTGQPITALPTPKKIQLKIAPNPSEDFFQVLGLDRESSFIVIDLLGNTVLSGYINKGRKINTQQLPKGIYLVQVDKHYTFKLFKK